MHRAHEPECHERFNGIVIVDYKLLLHAGTDHRSDHAARLFQHWPWPAVASDSVVNIFWKTMEFTHSSHWILYCVTYQILELDQSASIATCVGTVEYVHPS